MYFNQFDITMSFITLQRYILISYYQIKNDILLPFLYYLTISQYRIT
nr:MAG TPA: hypothetical protein [Caudoviricetes sp.]